MASSNVFEHSRPMLNRNGLADLAGLAVPHDRRRRGLAAHAHQREPAEAPLLRLAQRQRVGAVRVAAAGGGQHLVAVGDHDGLGLPRVVGLDAADQRGLDVVVLEQPVQHRRHEAAVLALRVLLVVGRPGEQQLPPDAAHLVGLAHPAEQVHVGRRLPRPEAGAGTGARGAALLAVDAVVEAELLLEVERLVLALFVLVPDDVVRAGDDAPGAAGAQPGGDDLGVQLLPLRGPPLGLASGRRRWCVLSDRHGARLCRRARARRTREPASHRPICGQALADLALVGRGVLLERLVETQLVVSGAQEG